jgi:NADH-quinone oxidoreductase subunit L
VGDGAVGLTWLIPALPLAGATLLLPAGRRLGVRAGWVATALVAGAFVASVAVLVQLLSLPAAERAAVVPVFRWIAAGRFAADVVLRVDPLSMTMALVVTGVGALIHWYAVGYMAHDPRVGRFFAYLNLFVSFMLLLVLANDYLLLYLGWEGVGLCSYLLIGFWHERPAAASAAKKAFVTTRIGDAALLLGIVLLWLHAGSLGFDAVLAEGAELSTGAATAISLLLLAGAVGKSAQLPLHVWLPDAMEGPTPVSALIHAATMVTAGVYLVVRSHPIFEASGVALPLVLAIGLTSALYAGLASIGQFDVKRALAYSTMSQIGLMFFAAGMRMYSGAMLLLVCHAFYKALLFLASGNVMHGLGDETDLRRMGGLRREMPTTAAWFAIGALALAGIPPLSGFFAKDHIVAFASTSGRTAAWILASLAAFVSAVYIARPLFLAFAGERRGPGHAHEAPLAMQAPLALLAAGSVVAGAVLGWRAEGALDGFLRPVTGALEHGEGGLPEGTLLLVSLAIALAGVGSAWWIWGSGRLDPEAFPRRRPELAEWLARAFYVNDLYAWLVRVPGAGLGRVLRLFDDRVVDGAVNGLGRDVARAARVAPVIQSGFVRSYALLFLLGATVLLLFLGTRI